jgi:hypothetical protein
MNVSVRFPKKFRLLSGCVSLVALSLLVYLVRPNDTLVYVFIALFGVMIFFFVWTTLHARFSLYLAVTASYTLYLLWKDILFIELFIYIFFIMLLIEGYVVVSRRVLQ